MLIQATTVIFSLVNTKNSDDAIKRTSQEFFEEFKIAMEVSIQKKQKKLNP